MPGTGLERFVLATLDTLYPGMPISDTQGHGTQMALIASGVVMPSGIKVDAAPHTPLIPIRAFDDNGFTSGFQLMQGIEFAMRNGARVLSLSWGTETRSGFLESALSDAASKGLVIVASAGNEPTGRPVYPAAYLSVIGVGALGPDGTIWKQSNFGSFVSLYAPGFATLPVGYKGDPGSYAGTSIAAAFTANRIAEYLSRHPDAGIQEIFDALRSKPTP
jgi:subtilisin family serine protease